MKELLRSPLHFIARYRPGAKLEPESASSYSAQEGENPELKFRLYKLPKEILKTLEPNERRLKRNYEEAVGLWAYVFNAQEGLAPDTNYLYEEGITYEEVRETAKLPGRSDLLKRDTIVVRDAAGLPTPIFYHQAYSGIYEEYDIDQPIWEACQTADKMKDDNTQAYLLEIINSLKTGDYKSPVRARQERKDEPPFELVLGFSDTNTDNFGIKDAAQAWATFLDKETTAEGEWFLNRVRNWLKDKTGVEPPKAKLRIGYLLAISGQAAKKDWVGNNQPSRPEWRKELGSKIDFFIQKFTAKFRTDWFPAFWSITSPRRRVGLEKKEVEQLVSKVLLRKDIAHEYAHSLIPEGLEDRLGDNRRLINIIKELYCELFALHVYGFMPQDPSKPQELTNRERDFALGAQFAEGVVDFRNYKEREEYFIINSIIKRELQTKGSILEENGRLDWDDSKAYPIGAALLDKVKGLIDNGTAAQVDDFLKTRFDPDTYEAIASKGKKRGLFNVKKNGRPVLTNSGPTEVSA